MRARGGMSEQPRIVLCIPGPWQDRSALIVQIAQANLNEALAAGMIVMDVARKRHAELAVYDRDERLATAFQKASAHALDEATLEAIGRNALVPCIAIDATEKGLAERLAFFSGVLRKAGGLAVKVQLAGVAHPWPRWDDLIGKGDPYSLYHALVVHVFEDGKISAFGMKQFGLPDAEIHGDPQSREVQWTLAAFNVYQWTEAPVFKTGQTFSREAGAPKYRLTQVADGRYPAGDAYHNPRGVWELRGT
jgi:hypothetical protein